jgi:hypothetical protein
MHIHGHPHGNMHRHVHMHMHMHRYRHRRQRRYRAHTVSALWLRNNSIFKSSPLAGVAALEYTLVTKGDVKRAFAFTGHDTGQEHGDNVVHGPSCQDAVRGKKRSTAPSPHMNYGDKKVCSPTTHMPGPGARSEHSQQFIASGNANPTSQEQCLIIASGL